MRDDPGGYRRARTDQLPYAHMRIPVIAAACAALVLAACSSAAPATYRAAVTNRAVLDSATLAVTVQVRNTSTTPGRPACTIQAADPASAHTGVVVATLRDELQPGKAVTFVDDVTITGNGASQVTTVTVSCA